MRICLACRGELKGEDWACPFCGKAPAFHGGIPLFAPELEADDSGYQQHYFDEIRALEAGSFWFRARNVLIQWSLAKYFPEAGTFLEVGCGTGFVLDGLKARFPGLRLTGSELSSRGLAIAADRLPEAELLQMDGRGLPFRSHFDVIGAFDVIEHIQEDEQVLGEIHQALRPGGGLLLTVPQHPFLWSKVDVFARHVRRYRRSELIEKLQRRGFTVLRATSFVSLLFPFLVLSRLAETFRPGARRGEAELALPRWLDRMLEGVMRVECAAIRAGVSFSLGGSLLVIAQRAKGDS